MPPEAELPRQALVSRVLSARPKLIVLEATAGFGKSTLARLLTAPKSVTCDTLGVATLLEFHRRLLIAIAAGCFERGIAIRREAANLADDAASWRRLIVSAWREPCEPDWFVLENAEQIASSLEAQRTLAGLFECPHFDRRVVICTRKPLDLGFGRFAFPHETVRLGTADLRFSPDEVRALFGGTLAADVALRIERLVAGWPMAVLMLRRLLIEGRRIEEFDVGRDLGLFEYLADQVLAALSPRAWRPLLIAAAVDNATVSDVEIAYDDDMTIADVALLRREAPFVEVVDGALVPHPLIRALLRARHPHDLAEAARHVAQAHERAGHRIRAAQLWLAAGEPRNAARAIAGLERPAWLGSPSFDLAGILAQLDRDAFVAYPALWAYSVSSRMSTVSPHDLMHEGLEIWNRGDSLLPEVALSVGISLCNAYYNLGMLDEFEALLNEISERIGGELAQSSASISVFRLGLEAVRGSAVDATPVEAALDAVPGNDGYRAVCLYDLIARGFRQRGEREAERSASAHALDVALASKLPHVIGLCTIDAAFGAWLAGEDALFSEYLTLLEVHVTAATVMTTRHFLACARGIGSVAEPGFEKVWFRAYGWLVALGSAQRAERQYFARLALEAADASGQLFIRTVARVAMALVDRPNAQSLLREALRLAGNVDGPGLREAVQSLLTGGDGSMLAPLAIRLGGMRSGCSLDVIAGTYSVNAAQVDMSDRSIEILILLGCRRRTLKRDEIAECLWPQAEPEQTRGALRTAISRLRMIPGMRDAVLSSPAGYTLAADMRVDLDVIRQALMSSETRDGPSPAALQILEPAFEALLSRDVTRAARWEWFTQTERDLEELLRGIAAQLGRAALARSDTQRALEIARLLAERDPADEEACELAMRTFLAAGDAAAARRELHRYETHAAADLGISVLSPLRQLLPRSIT